MSAFERLRRSASYRSARGLHATRMLFLRAVAAGFPGVVNFPPPLYIVGCPSSGKTTLAALLRQHPHLLVLTEPVQLWAEAFPATFLDARGTRAARSRLALTAEDCDPAGIHRLRFLLWAELKMAGRRYLADENPWYSFRIDFLRSIFPAARFLHVVRDGEAVARQIEDRCRAGALWGKRPLMWQIIAEYAQASEPYRSLLSLCRTDFDRGLLLWKMTVETVRAAARDRLSSDDYMEVQSEQLIGRPQQTCREIAAFIGLDLDAPAWERAIQQMRAASLPRFPGEASSANA